MGPTNTCYSVIMEALAACWGTFRVVAAAWTAGRLGVWERMADGVLLRKWTVTLQPQSASCLYLVSELRVRTHPAIDETFVLRPNFNSRLSVSVTDRYGGMALPKQC